VSEAISTVAIATTPKTTLFETILLYGIFPLLLSQLPHHTKSIYNRLIQISAGRDDK
jgi:hypothetical protein